jgi:hypothetical protein
MESGKIGPFGSNHYPFYYFHAKLYLLIALSRAAIDNAGILQSHLMLFTKIALEGTPHILIQRTAAQIALLIEKSAPGSCATSLVTKLENVGKSPFSVLERDRHTKALSTPWHIKGQVNRNLKVHFGYDFDSYWFPPLARVFGIPEEEIDDLACEVACADLNIPSGNDFVPDPRQHLWNSLDRSARTTYASHGAYPRVDNYSFYYSYHSLLSVAAKLLSSMPAVRFRDHYVDYEDNWEEWLRGHLLSRTDGKWLSDRRDPSPMIRRAWTKKSPQKDWLWEIKADDFFEAIYGDSPLPSSICVKGSWNDCYGRFEETIMVETALVSTDTANSLANALRTCEDSFSCYFPTDDEAKPDDVSPFTLLKWIRHNENGGHGLDRFDPYAAEINYPPDEVKSHFATLLGLLADSERRDWKLHGEVTPSLVCEIWSEPTDRSQYPDPTRAGQRMTARVDLLKTLCQKTGKELIFLVNIERREHRHSASRDENDVGLIPPSHKVFILSSNGNLRDSTKNHKIG